MKAILSILVAALCAAATWFVPPSQAQSTFPGPVVSTATLPANTGFAIANANPSRRTIQICNTGGTNPLWIWPGTLSPTVSAYVIPPVTSNVIACYTPPSGLTGGLGAQWNGAALNGTTYSVFEY